MNQSEVERLDGLEHRRGRVLPRPSRTGSSGTDLEVRLQVVRDDDQLSPGTAGHRRHSGKREAAALLADRLLVMAATGHDVPQTSDGEPEVARRRAHRARRWSRTGPTGRAWRGDAPPSCGRWPPRRGGPRACPPRQRQIPRHLMRHGASSAGSGCTTGGPTTDRTAA